MGVLVRNEGSTNDGLNFRGKEYAVGKNGKIENFPHDLTKDEAEQLAAHGFKLEPVIRVEAKPAEASKPEAVKA